MDQVLQRIANLSPQKRALLEQRLKEKRISTINKQVISRRKDDNLFPLSFAQQRLWFLDQLDPENPFYNIYYAFRLTGSVNISALEKSLGEILRRHEVLRSTFLTVDGHAKLVISSPGRINLPITDLSHLSQMEQNAEVQRLVTEDAQRPFNLARGPLFRARLLKLTNEHVLVLSMHHIVFDGWSMGVLYRELEALYDAYSKGNPSPLPELSIQYSNFAYWQRQWLQGQVLEAQLSYWNGQLGGVLPVLQLPTDRPRPAIQSFHGAKQTFSLPGTLSEALKNLSQREGVTLFMTLLAAFKILLYRYTGQEDIIVGSPIANRTRVETEPLIGFFVNTLVLRTDLSGNPTFRELLSRVRDIALGAYAHQDLPFEKLIEELQLDRDLSRSPLFQVMFAYQNTPLEQLKLSGLTITSLDIHGGTAKFDLELSMEEQESFLHGSLEYNTDLFDSTTIMRMLKHFQTLLASIVSNPEQHISTLPLLTEPERHELLVTWNNTEVKYPQDLCLHQLFEVQVEKTPDHIALVFEGKQLTYRELNQQANQLAHHLRAWGVKPDKPVGICMDRSLEMIVGLLGILKAGAAYVPLDPNYPKERLNFLLADANVALILTQAHLMAALPEIKSRIVCLDSEWDLIADQLSTNPVTEITPDNLAYVIYTSGSTGKPKGSMIAHHGICNRLLWMQETYKLTDTDRVLQKTPFSFDVSVWEFFWPLITGARLVIARPEGHKDSSYLVELIIKENITVLHFVPSMLHIFLEEPRVKLCQSLRLVISSGEALSFETQKRFFTHLNAELHNLYGPTEASVDVTYWQCTRESKQHTIPIGRPIANIQIYLLDSLLQPVPVGVPGELYIGGIGLARGYLHRPELTAEKFIPHPFSSHPGARLYKTGDLARFLPDGNIEFLGRIDYQVKIRGLRIELGEIDAVLNQHPAIREAIVIDHQDLQGDKRLVAYYVPEPEATFSINELRNFLKEKLPDYMVPAVFVMLHQLPLTPNGKVDRRALPSPDLTRPELEETYVAPRTPEEEILANIWAKILGLEQVGIYDNFFSLGGDSIRSIQIRAQAQQRGLNFSLQQLFQYQTIHELIQVIKIQTMDSEAATKSQPFSMIATEDRQRIPEDVSDAYPLALLQAGMLYHSEYSPDSSSYHDIISYHLKARFDLELLQTAIQQVLYRHDVLRTSFDLTSFSEMLQLVHNQASASIQVEDLQQWSRERQDEILVEWLEAEKHHHYDLTRPPLLRFQVHRRSHDTFQFTMSFHHAILDGWSAATMLTELFQRYLSLLKGEIQSPEPPLAVTFRDFIALEKKALQSEIFQTYWRQKLINPTIIPLPSWNSNSPGTGASKNELFNIPIPDMVFKGLQKLARTASVPLKTVLLAGHLKVMNLLSNQTDILTGLVVNGRPEETDGERILGLFLNTLPFRMKLIETTWIDLVQEVFANERELFPYRRYPLAQIQKEQGGRQLFDWAFNFNYFHVYEELEKLHDLEILEVIGFEQTNFTMIANFNLNPFSSRIHLTLNYDTSRLSKKQVEAIGGYYVRVLTAMSNQPSGHFELQDFLSENERHQLLVEWNNTKTDYPQNRCIHQLFETQVERAPNAIAVIFEEKQLTYQELNQQSNRLAHYLQRFNVGPEVRVGIFMERSLEMIVGLLGILKAGGAYMPLDLSYPEERLRFMIEDAGIDVLLTQKSLLDLLPRNQGHIICLDSDQELISNESCDNPVSTVTPKNLAYINYTSGSTGKPKGVEVVHQGVTRLLFGGNYVQLNATQILLHAAPISFDASTFEIWGALLHGGRCIIFPQRVPTPGDLGEIIQQHGVTTLWLTASLFNTVIDDAPEVLSGLKQLLIGGEALSVAHVRRALETLPATQIINGYGPTEGTTFTCCYPIPGQLEEKIRSVPIGGPIGNTQVYILDPHLNPVPVGVPGELYIGGAGLARGYLNQPKLTAEKFIPNPFTEEPGARLYKTGDLVRYLSDGNIEFIGRIDDQVKIHGFRIELGEIESVLGQHPALRQIAVAVREDITGEKRLVAYLVPELEPAPTVSEIRKFLKQQLPEYMIPATFVTLDSLPLTASGKINRQLLPAPGSTRPELNISYEAPRNTVEEILANIWAEALHIEKVGIHDDFFELGGDSILSLQIIAKAAQAGISLTPGQLAQAPTIAALASIVNSIPAIQAEQGTVVGPVPLTPIQHWFFEQNIPEPHHWNQTFLFELQQPLEVARLKKVIQHLIFHHDALRLRFNHDESGWSQTNTGSEESIPFSIIDLSPLSEPEQTAAIESIATEVQSSLNLSQGPLLRVVLFDLGSNKPGRLLIVIHHLVTDGVSWRILLEDLQTAYQQLLQGQPIQVPAKTTSFRHWSQRLMEYAQSPEFQQEFTFWQAQHCPNALPCPLDFPDGINSEASARTITLSLSTEQTQILLQHVPKAFHTQINEVLLTALLLTLSHWTGQKSLLVDLEGHGREELFPDINLSRTIGWFTSIFPVFFEFSPALAPEDTLRIVQEHLRRIPNHGIGYGLLRYLTENQEITAALRNFPQPEICFNYLGQFDQVLSASSLLKLAQEPYGPDRSPLGKRRYVMDVVTAIIAGQFHLEWKYSENLHRRPTVEGLAQRFMETLGAFISRSQSLAIQPAIISDNQYQEFQQSSHDQSPLVCLQPGDSRRPFFCIHAAGGNVLCYVNLSKLIGKDQPFYGLQSRGLNNEQEPCTQIESMATDYIKAVRSIQPEGPYLLGGWCLGGSIAFEMAQQLHAKGQHVALLALIDSLIPVPIQEQFEEDTAELLAGLFAGVIPLSPDQLRQLDPDEQLRHVVHQARKYHIISSDMGISQVRRRLQIYKTHVKAWLRYVPQPYAGPITFFRASQQPEGVPSSELGWLNVAKGGIDIHIVPGEHSNLVNKPHVQVLAQKLRKCIDNVQIYFN